MEEANTSNSLQGSLAADDATGPALAVGADDAPLDGVGREGTSAGEEILGGGSDEPVVPPPPPEEGRRKSLEPWRPADDDAEVADDDPPPSWSQNAPFDWNRFASSSLRFFSASASARCLSASESVPEAAEAEEDPNESRLLNASDEIDPPAGADALGRAGAAAGRDGGGGATEGE